VRPYIRPPASEAPELGVNDGGCVTRLYFKYKYITIKGL
jgi:hypothetical protein